MFIQTLFSQENKTYELKSFNFKPTLGVGIGMMNYYGDISTNNRTNNPLISEIGYDFRVSFPLYRGFDIHFNTLLGSVSATELSTTRNLNFSSRIFGGGISVAYNFDHFLPENRKVDPFILTGFELIEYVSKTDLYDEFGNEYIYWSDGTIRNLPESPENELISTRLSRDYVYETDIRKLNADGFGNYPEQSIGVPIGVGANLYVTDKISLRVGSTMHILFNDYLEGITAQSVGVRKGNSANDMFLYSYASISYNLSNSPNTFLGLSRKDLKALDLGDEDDDGVIDFKDECPQTPYGAPIDAKGCPLDSDKDGVPDYKDLEEDTPENAVVDSLGRSMSDEQLQEVAKIYNDTTGGEYQDTSFALELTDKTKRPGKGGTPPSSGGVEVGPSSGQGAAGAGSGAAANAIEGLSIPTPECYDGGYYMVQIMATKVKPRKNPFPSLSDLSGSEFGDGYYRFFSGAFNNKKEADVYKNQLKTQGISGPFVRAFQDCKLLPIGTEPTGTPANIAAKPVGKSSNEQIQGIEVPKPDCPGGIIYRVQVSAQKAKPKNNPFPNISDLSATYFADGYYRFFAGEYTSEEEANRRKDELRASGVKGAFVRAFDNCEILPPNAKPTSSGNTPKANTTTPTTPKSSPSNNSAPVNTPHSSN